ncbi:hypothetical protein QJQ45_009916 [Haematococcus lacustris]|nr:hypothetical protein QJQ45_009916 [Haematococcus lacustris]
MIHVVLTRCAAERYVKLWAKAARSKYGINLEVSKRFVRVACQYGLNSSSSELRGAPLESPEWQERMAFHRHVLTGVLEAATPGDPADSEEPEDPDAPPAITQLPLHRRILYAIYVNRCLEEWQDPNPPAPPPKGEGKGKGKGPRLEEEAASVSQQEWGARKQLVMFFGNAGIGTRGGWGVKAVLQACRKVVEGANSGKPTDRVPGRVVTVDEFRTSRVSSVMNSPQPCEEELDSSKPTRPEDWKPKPGQVQNRLLRSAWSKRFEVPVRGLMWCPWLAQATPAKRSKRTKAEQASEPTQPTKGKGKAQGKAAKAKPGPQPGRWLDRDCNEALNMQRIGRAGGAHWSCATGQTRQLCQRKGKVYPGLGYKRVRDKPPLANEQQPPAVAQ